MKNKFYYILGISLYEIVSAILTIAAIIIGPGRLINSFSRIGQKVFLLFAPNHYKLAVIQLTWVKNWIYKKHEIDIGTPEDIAKKAIGRMISNYMTLFIIRYLINYKKYYFHGNISDVKEISHSIHKDTSVLILGGHIGLFEVSPHILIKKGYPFFTVAKKLKSKLLTSIIYHVRKNILKINILWREDPQSAKTLLLIAKNLKMGVVATLLDQSTNLNNIYIDFFGIKASTPYSLTKLAVKKQMNILTAFLIPQSSHFEHKFELQKIKYDPKNPNCITNILNEYSKRLEDVLIKDPSLWPWHHRRWRRQPGQSKLPDNEEYILFLNDQIDRICAKD